MSKKHFSGLLIITVIVAAAVFLIPSKTGREIAPADHDFLPDLAAAVNDLERVRVVKGGDEVVATLERGEDGWVVAEAEGYPADWDALRTLLADLSTAAIVEQKTANPEYYPRLGVENVSDPDAGGALLQLGEGDGRIDVIVGKTAQGGAGQYVRVANEERSLLIDRRLTVPADTTSWLDRDIIDVSGDEVVEVEVEHADGERILAKKASVDDPDFVLQDIPEGREVKSAWSVNQLGGALASLRLESVMPDSGVDWTDAIRFRLLTADGLEVVAGLVTLEEKHWIRLQAAAYGAVEEDPEAAESTGAADRAAEINARVAGWAYEIPQYKADAISKRGEDVLAPLEEEED